MNQCIKDYTHPEKGQALLRTTERRKYDLEGFCLIELAAPVGHTNGARRRQIIKGQL